ncbi:MAG TPA: hypothetical protein PLV25_07275, partial [Opitutales bacterium]|nr:hypothetical protein [Opitutales bacterium]
MPKAYAQALEYFKPSARELIIHSPLEHPLFTKPDVHLWLEAQRGLIPKQSYVNSCIALSFMVELWQQAPSLGALYLLGQAIYTQIANRSDLFQTSLAAQTRAWPNGLRYVDCINDAVDEARSNFVGAHTNIQA